MEAMHKKRVHKETKTIGFTSQEAGGRHFFMRHSTYTLTIPSNKEYSIPQLKMLLHEIEEGIGRKITIEEWYSL
jgi:predicted RNA binding protein YcfA (HicA-like mRNA interferase family)